ncbi:MAG TPA: hypothetical protein VGV59_01750 [Pyrinomonadaceae bacterium]|nr:hypothetical protein [Pyrinomonadaceae bacterium]
MTDNYSRNRALVRYLLLPTIFLTVALLGGLRVAAGSGALVFLAPPLVTLLLSVLLVLLFARGRMIEVESWLSLEHHPLTNVAHALLLLSLFFASAQSFNSVLPEAGLLRWMLSFFFLWTLWQNQFASFDARRTLRSVAALFGTAFVVKHLLLAGLYAPDGGWLRRLTGVLLEGVTLGTLDAPAHAPATGYISFFTLALYVCGLWLLPAAPEAEVADAETNALVLTTGEAIDATTASEADEDEEPTLVRKS